MAVDEQVALAGMLGSEPFFRDQGLTSLPSPRSPGGACRPTM